MKTNDLDNITMTDLQKRLKKLNTNNTCRKCGGGVFLLMKNNREFYKIYLSLPLLEKYQIEKLARFEVISTEDYLLNQVSTYYIATLKTPFYSAYY